MIWYLGKCRKRGDIMDKMTIDNIGEQLSLFDIELPPNDVTEVKTMIENTPNNTPYNIPIKTTPLNFAEVPEEEFNYKSAKDVPTVNEILKMLNKGLYKVNTHEFLSDIFECGAIAISNRFDKSQAPQREERYLRIMKKYDSDVQKLICDIFVEIYALLIQQINPSVGFNDYLGQLYMLSETSNKHTGQFFTPYCVSKMCAECTINESMVKEYMQQDKILTLNEPTCGAGGMIIAAVDVLYNKYHFNYSRNLLVECSDIDSRCVHMTYLQLALAGIPAIIYHRDTLLMKTWERWETPAYIMQWLRFRNVLKN